MNTTEMRLLTTQGEEWSPHIRQATIGKINHFEIMPEGKTRICLKEDAVTKLIINGLYFQAINNNGGMGPASLIKDVFDKIDENGNIIISWHPDFEAKRIYVYRLSSSDLRRCAGKNFHLR